jgi:hypothetical protein
MMLKTAEICRTHPLSRRSSDASAASSATSVIYCFSRSAALRKLLGNGLLNLGNAVAGVGVSAHKFGLRAAPPCDESICITFIIARGS